MFSTIRCNFEVADKFLSLYWEIRTRKVRDSSRTRKVRFKSSWHTIRDWFIACLIICHFVRNSFLWLTTCQRRATKHLQCDIPEVLRAINTVLWDEQPVHLKCVNRKLTMLYWSVLYSIMLYWSVLYSNSTRFIFRFAIFRQHLQYRISVS